MLDAYSGLGEHYQITQGISGMLHINTQGSIVEFTDMIENLAIFNHTQAQ